MGKKMTSLLIGNIKMYVYKVTEIDVANCMNYKQKINN